MNESVPSFGGAKWPQFEASTENRRENTGDIEQPDMAPVQELGQRALESADSAENTEEDAYSGAIAEAIPAMDTAESLAERQEKLKKGIKIVIGGPPHSGKSVFIEALTQNLDKDNTFSFSAAPDGEVVPTLEAGTGVVGDFVADKPRLGKRGAGRGDLGEGRVVGRQRQLPSPQGEVEARLRLADKGVDAAVVKSERRGARERGAPRIGRRAGPSRNQVDARVREARRTHGAERRRGLSGRVEPPHRLQHIVVEALHPHRNSIYTALFEHFQHFWPRIQGVELNRKLGDSPQHFGDSPLFFGDRPQHFGVCPPFPQGGEEGRKVAECRTAPSEING